MNTKQNAVQELKSERVQQELAVEESPLVIELKSERVQAPANVSQVGEAAMRTALQLTVNQKKRVVIDVWGLEMAITLDNPADGTAQPSGRPEQAA